MSEVYDIFVRQYEDNSVPLATLTVSKDTTIGEIKKMLLKNCKSHEHALRCFFKINYTEEQEVLPPLSFYSIK